MPRDLSSSLRCHIHLRCDGRHPCSYPMSPSAVSLPARRRHQDTGDGDLAWWLLSVTTMASRDYPCACTFDYVPHFPRPVSTEKPSIGLFGVPVPPTSIFLWNSWSLMNGTGSGAIKLLHHRSYSDREINFTRCCYSRTRSDSLMNYQSPISWLQVNAIGIDDTYWLTQ
jgi:hypothetical protein